MQLTSTKKQTHCAPVILLHGQPNTGKSLGAATCVVNGKPPLIILFERGGTESLKEENIIRVFGKGREDVAYDLPVLECFDIGDTDSVVALLEEQKAWILENCGAIIVDSLSAAASRVLKEAKESGLTHGQQVYGLLAERITGLYKGITEFCNDNGLPVIYQAQSSWSEEPGTEGQILYPVFEGKKLMSTIPHDTYEVWGTFVDGEGADGRPVYGLQLLRSGNIFAKSRWGAVERVTGDHCHLGKLIEMKMGKRPVPDEIRIPDRVVVTAATVETLPTNKKKK